MSIQCTYVSSISWVDDFLFSHGRIQAAILRFLATACYIFSVRNRRQPDAYLCSNDQRPLQLKFDDQLIAFLDEFYGDLNGPAWLNSIDCDREHGSSNPMAPAFSSSDDSTVIANGGCSFWPAGLPRIEPSTTDLRKISIIPWLRLSVDRYTGFFVCELRSELFVATDETWLPRIESSVEEDEIRSSSTRDWFTKMYIGQHHTSDLCVSFTCVDVFVGEITIVSCVPGVSCLTQGTAQCKIW